MWIVALALRRPYTFVVLALLLLILGPIVIFRTPTDIFPNIDIPVVSILWNYTGLNSQDMANRIVTLTERTLTTTVDNIEHSESQSLNGIAVVKVFFQPHANIEKAIAQITAISQTSVRGMPPGTTPPLIISYSASTTPNRRTNSVTAAIPDTAVNPGSGAPTRTATRTPPRPRTLLTR